MPTDPLPNLLKEIRACRICAPHLTHEPRPVLQASTTARIVIAAQAPGRKVQASGQPFTDASGDRLRDWLGISKDVFYDAARINIIPMGFCFPGAERKKGDLPPRPECRQTWHDRLFGTLPAPKLKLIMGQYAIAYHLGRGRERTLTATVKAWRRFWPEAVVMPHPSPRNTYWLQKNPWFEAEVLPAVRERILYILNEP